MTLARESNGSIADDKLRIFCCTSTACLSSISEAFKQAFQDTRAGRMIIADIGHQLPALLDDLERSAGAAYLGGFVLRFGAALFPHRADLP